MIQNGQNISNGLHDNDELSYYKRELVKIDTITILHIVVQVYGASNEWNGPDVKNRLHIDLVLSSTIYYLCAEVNPYFKSPLISQSVNCSFHLPKHRCTI